MEIDGSQPFAPASGPEPAAAVYVMSVAAELTGIHPQTLRAYERRGLVEPARSAAGRRRYSEADLQRISRIGRLTTAGINLEGVRRILQLEHELDTLTAELRRLRNALADTTTAQPTGDTTTDQPTGGW